MPGRPDPFFLDVDGSALGSRFAIHHVPSSGATKGLVVHVHPFAEEMNKSRRMAALQARALARAGFAVLQMDLLGCGDSAGEFGDATWSQWVDDVVFAIGWLQQRHAQPAAGRDQLPLWLWGHRSGALLAADAVTKLGSPCNFLLWQPTLAGKSVLQQFLRLKSAGQLASGQAKGAVQGLRDELAAGRSVEVAGYTLHPSLCRGLDEAVLRPPSFDGGGRRLEWLEVSPAEDAAVSAAALAQAAQWHTRGWATNTHIVRGPAFWQTTEIEDAPALLEASVRVLIGDTVASAAAGST